MRNPIARKRKMITRYRNPRRESYKISLLRRISYEISTETLIKDSDKVRKALIEITEDEQLWQLLKTFANDVKLLAKHGLEYGD